MLAKQDSHTGLSQRMTHFSLLGRLNTDVKRGKISSFCCKCRRPVCTTKSFRLCNCGGLFLFSFLLCKARDVISLSWKCSSLKGNAWQMPDREKEETMCPSTDLKAFKLTNMGFFLNGFNIPLFILLDTWVCWSYFVFHHTCKTQHVFPFPC